jgi:hypothetical protein
VMALLMLGLGAFWIQVHRGYARARAPSPLMETGY